MSSAALATVSRSSCRASRAMYDMAVTLERRMRDTAQCAGGAADRRDRAGRLIRRGVKTEDVEIFPVTPREKRYVELRDRIGLSARASRYLRQRPNLSGGISIEDAWPRDPYVLVRL